MAGVNAVSDFDAGVTAGYLRRAEELLELAIEFAQDRRRMPRSRVGVESLYPRPVMKLLQVLSRDGSRLYGAMIRKQAEIRRNGRGTFLRAKARK
jgi:hypothetical protein